MKKTICLILAYMILVLCASCGSKRMDGISDRAYELGCAALETADEFIAGTITAREAKSKLESADILLGGDDCDGQNDSLVSASVGLLSIKIGNKDTGSGTMDDVKKERDRLADYLGK